MYPIEKTALALSVGLVVIAIGAAILNPVISGEKELQKNMDKGSEVIRTAFIEVKPNGGSAILLAPSRNERHYQISLDKKSEMDWNHPKTFESPTPISVKVGSLVMFGYRHYGYAYRVTDINPKGVEVEMGRDGWFVSKKRIFLPRK